jgi:putative PEP-CTERM system histidine kinase
VTIVTVSYGIAGAAFALLATLLVANWRGKSHGTLLAAATALSALWAVTVAVTATGSAPAALSAEFLRSGGWLLFLIKVVETSTSGASRTLRTIRLVLGAGVLLGVALSMVAPGSVLGHIVLPLGLAVAGLALVEQTYRNANDAQRWALKYLCLGLGAIFAYDFYLYADALLFKHVDAQLWSARGLVNALVVPLILVSAARSPSWAVEVHVSRGFVFHTAALLGAGVYLLAMSAAGYYIRLFGGSWGTIAQTVFLVGAIMVLVGVLFSGSWRAALRVFLAKHFFSYKYDYRHEWLRFTRLLSAGEPGQPVRERALQALAGLLESPAAALWLPHEGGVYRQVAGWNMPAIAATEPGEGALVRFLSAEQWVIDLQEFEHSPEMYGDLQLPKWLLQLPKAWLIMPLVLHDRVSGFVVFARAISPRGINWEDRDLLKTAGGQAAVYLAQADANEALVQARQFESFNRLATFVVHDLKNVIAQLTLMLANAEKHKHKPEFQDDMLETVANAAQKMSRLLTQLRAGYQTAQGATVIHLGDLLEGLVHEKSAHRPVPTLTQPAAPVWVMADRERLARVLGHLIQNAIEATPESGVVEVTLAEHDAHAVITVRDTGHGMDEAFIRDNLFRPFASTKPSGMGIGAYECREYVRELQGEIRVRSEAGKGSVFEVTLPCHVRQDDAVETSNGQGVAGG